MFPVKCPDLFIYAGDDFSESYAFTEDDRPYSLEGFTAWKSQWRQFSESTTAIDFTITVSKNELTLHMDADDTALISSGVWDVQAVHEGKTITLLRGAVIVEKDVTR